ncbi:ABC transporter substrate-binding protein [Alkalibaculum bacchi]|uniref:ABC transporter substrate-binding protein n=1 Tax=Alkalibaculum bacchi TaxID=645887 RepID=UPI0026F1FC86|nr:ABC transporter substrate-binding protein [Alkalibaculum bacchi]
MKKIIALVVLLVVLFSAVACTSQEKSDTLTVGIIQLTDNGAFTDMREGFINRLRELGYTEDKLIIVEKSAQGDMSNLNSICQEMVNSGVDLVATIATPASQAMVNMNTDIPVIFISVGDPTGAGIISNMEKPDKNATGTSNAIPVDEMFKMADSLTPGIETYGILYNTSEKNSVTTVEKAKVYFDTNGIQYVEAVVPDSSEVQQATQSLIGKVDAIFVPNDSKVQAAMPQVADIAKTAQIPVYGSSAVMVESGAFATISISDIEIGALSADMADQVLKGTQIDQIPAITVSNFTTVINKETASEIGVELSKDILSTATIIE